MAKDYSKILDNRYKRKEGYFLIIGIVCTLLAVAGLAVGIVLLCTCGASTVKLVFGIVLTALGVINLPFAIGLIIVRYMRKYTSGFDDKDYEEGGKYDTKE